MKVILRNMVNNLYLVDQEHWTKDPFKALDFGRADRAIEVARQSGLANMELLMSVNDVNFEICRPLAESAPTPARASSTC